MDDVSTAALGPRPARAAGRLSPEREAVLEVVLDQPEPVSLRALARLTGRHENTVREHLNALVEGGFVGRTAERTPGRGRPRWNYHGEGRPAREPEHAGLATALVRMLVDAGDEESPEELRERAVVAGVTWGHELAATRDVPAERAARELVDMLDD